MRREMSSFSCEIQYWRNVQLKHDVMCICGIVTICHHRYVWPRASVRTKELSYSRNNINLAGQLTRRILKSISPLLRSVSHRIFLCCGLRPRDYFFVSIRDVGSGYLFAKSAIRHIQESIRDRCEFLGKARHHTFYPQMRRVRVQWFYDNVLAMIRGVGNIYTVCLHYPESIRSLAIAAAVRARSGIISRKDSYCFIA